MKWLRVMVIVFFLVLTIPIALSAPPFENQQFTGDTLQIKYPQANTFKLNDNISFNFHVYNITGLQLEGAEATCEIHIYDKNNIHINESELTAVGDDYEYNYTPTNIGVHSYITWCNASGIGGFVGSEFDVSQSGIKEQEESRILIAIIILLPMLLAFLFMMAATSLGEEHTVLKIALFLITPFLFLISSGYGLMAIVKFYNYTELQEVMSTNNYWLTWFFVVLITYFLIYLFIKITHNIAEKKKEELKY